MLVVTAWDGDLFVGVNLLLAALAYCWGVHRVRRAGGRWPFGRTIAFLGALALLALAYLGPFGALAHEWFWAHMGQHLLVMMLAAPILVLGDPVRLAWRASGPAGRARLEAVMGSRVVSFLARPVVGWLAFAIVLLGGHAPFAFDATLGSHDVMAFIERPLVLGVSLVFYYPLLSGALLRDRPAPIIRLASVGSMMIPETALGFVIFFSPVVLYTPYAQFDRLAGSWSALDDQKLAGAIMWAMAMVIDTGWVMLTAVEWFRSEEERTAELEREEQAEQARQSEQEACA